MESFFVQVHLFGNPPPVERSMQWQLEDGTVKTNNRSECSCQSCGAPSCRNIGPAISGFHRRAWDDGDNGRLSSSTWNCLLQVESYCVQREIAWLCFLFLTGISSALRSHAQALQRLQTASELPLRAIYFESAGRILLRGLAGMKNLFRKAIIINDSRT